MRHSLELLHARLCAAGGGGGCAALDAAAEAEVRRGNSQTMRSIA
jgi:hypothetical protein